MYCFIKYKIELPVGLLPVVGYIMLSICLFVVALLKPRAAVRKNKRCVEWQRCMCYRLIDWLKGKWIYVLLKFSLHCRRDSRCRGISRFENSGFQTFLFMDCTVYIKSFWRAWVYKHTRTIIYNIHYWPY